MLAPHSRTLLLEALRPPAGYHLSDAVATTYSLNLLALLVAPVGFTSFELQDSDGPIIGDGDALMLLRTIRRHAAQMTLFCQAGQIAEAPAHSRLLSALEPCVTEVTAPLGGVFHPKVWVMRYVAGTPDPATPDEDPVTESATGIRYRVLIATRNLTFDRSWDTILTLDGELKDRSRVYAANRPLVEFIAALPTMAVRKPVLERVSRRVTRLADELLRVEFELPQGFDSCVFHPLGITTSRRSPIRERADKLLVVSPFVSEAELARLGDLSINRTLVSRPDTLVALPAGALDDWTTLVLAPDAEGVHEMEGDDETDDTPSLPNRASTVMLRGLHAKLYVADHGWNANLWTGSANATNAAYTKNVELLVQLTGKRSQCGVDALLNSTDGSTSLRDLLVDFVPDTSLIDLDVKARAAEHALDSVRCDLASLGWRAVVTQSGDAPGWTVAIRSVRPPSTKLIAQLESLSARPITLNDSHALPLQVDHEGVLATRFESVSLESLSAFIALSVHVTVNGASAGASFVVTATLEGAPDSRQEAILRHLLRDREQVMRFLMLLLTDDLHGYGGGGMSTYGGSVAQDGATAVSPPQALLEPLLRALYRTPERLDEIAQFARDLVPKAPDEPSLLPDGLEDIVTTLRTARDVLK